jgi:hypothetical protein
MAVIIDSERGKKIAEILYNIIPSRDDYMPEDALPNGVVKGSLEHVLS